MLQAWRIGLEMVREEAHPVAKRLEVTDAALLEFVEATLRWGDIGMRTSAAAHREGEIRELERLAAEQAALRRVAELVARQAPPEQVFALVTEELSRVLGVDLMARTVRFEPDGTATILAARGGPEDLLPPGTNTPRPEGGILDQVLATGRPGRVDDYARLTGPLAVALRAAGIGSAAAGPIVVDGRTWGAMAVSSRRALAPRNRRPCRSVLRACVHGDLEHRIASARWSNWRPSRRRCVAWPSSSLAKHRRSRCSASLPRSSVACWTPALSVRAGSSRTGP